MDLSHSPTRQSPLLSITFSECTQSTFDPCFTFAFETVAPTECCAYMYCTLTSLLLILQPLKFTQFVCEPDRNLRLT